MRIYTPESPAVKQYNQPNFEVGCGAGRSGFMRISPVSRASRDGRRHPSRRISDDSLLHLAETLSLPVDDALRAAIADVQQLAVSAQAAPFAAARAASVVLALRPDAEILSLWLADAVRFPRFILRFSDR